MSLAEYLEGMKGCEPEAALRLKESLEESLAKQAVQASRSAGPKHVKMSNLLVAMEDAFQVHGRPSRESAPKLTRSTHGRAGWPDASADRRDRSEEGAGFLAVGDLLFLLGARAVRSEEDGS